MRFPERSVKFNFLLTYERPTIRVERKKFQKCRYCLRYQGNLSYCRVYEYTRIIFTESSRVKGALLFFQAKNRGAIDWPFACINARERFIMSINWYIRCATKGEHWPWQLDTARIFKSISNLCLLLTFNYFTYKSTDNAERLNITSRRRSLISIIIKN